MKNNYNGWTNYATWRINLEILGDIQWVEEEIEILDGTELDVKGLEGDEYNHLMTMIYNATIEKLKIEIDEK